MICLAGAGSDYATCQISNEENESQRIIFLETTLVNMSGSHPLTWAESKLVKSESNQWAWPCRCRLAGQAHSDDSSPHGLICIQVVFAYSLSSCRCFLIQDMLMHVHEWGNYVHERRDKGVLLCKSLELLSSGTSWCTPYTVQEGRIMWSYVLSHRYRHRPASTVRNTGTYETLQDDPWAMSRFYGSVRRIIVSLK